MSHAPSFMRAPAPVRSRRGEWIALVLLALALLAQLFFSQRAQLAADARWRPLVLSACGALRCSVPAWREPGAFSMLSRDVIAVPGRPGVLRVQASFRNDAAWPQPWPAAPACSGSCTGLAFCETPGSASYSPMMPITGRPEP